MSTPAQPATSLIGSVDAQRVEDALSLIAPKWTTWSAQTLAQQGGPMRVRDVAARLPFLSEQLVGNSLSSVHRALSDWSQAHLPLGKVAGAERVEDAVRRLHLRHSTAVIQILDAGGPMRFVHIAEQAGLDNGFTRQRLNRLQVDGLVTRTGPRHGDPYVLTAAGRALGPVYAAIEQLEQPRRRITSPAPVRVATATHTHTGIPLGSDGIQTAAALRRSTAAPSSLFSHAPQPQLRVPAAPSLPGPPLSWPLIRMASNTRSPSPPPSCPRAADQSAPGRARARPPGAVPVIATSPPGDLAPDTVERPLSVIPDRNMPYVTVSPVGSGADQRRSAALTRMPHTSQAGATPPTASPAAGLPAPGPSRRR